MSLIFKENKEKDLVVSISSDIPYDESYIGVVARIYYGDIPVARISEDGSIKTYDVGYEGELILGGCGIKLVRDDDFPFGTKINSF